jgi:hypothetical protein
LNDAEEREENFKKMHETMLEALKHETPEKNLFQKELDFAS